MKKTILIIEDDPSIRDVVSIVLKDAGYNTESLRSDDDVLNKILTLRPDGIVLDIIRPTEESTVICRSIKEKEEVKNIPVIVLSTHPNAVVVKEICANEVMPKPFDIEYLVSIIRKLI